MRWPFRTPVSFINARVVTDEGIASSIRFAATVLALDERPQPGDAVVDLEGAFILPGLINAHDHLELNHYGALKRRERYANATEWIDDMRPALHGDAGIRRNSAYPLADRLFIGGLKNLLAGVTTVAHHNPLYRGIGRAVPVRVVTQFGWAHSFTLERHPVGANGEPGGIVRERCAQTAAAAPFIVHAGEGVDGRAADEITRLHAESCMRANTVVVHGVALTVPTWRRAVGQGASLVWCPASNAFLFGCTTPVRELLDVGGDAPAHICLGSDSRVTGARDLLDEMRHARASGKVTAAELLYMVTEGARRVLKLRHGGRLVPGAPADLIAIPATCERPAAALLTIRRDRVTFVAIGGRPMIAESRFAKAFAARRVRTRDIAVDGAPRLASSALAATLERCPIAEPGVACA